ncbi:hypothetical protein SK224_08355 [Microbacterium sp. BG28]|uniref:hypothetical protein n=1 Tax=Microbacterium sp. BG28 TaxID=3097356 RepID=UPI002A599961|nr:hypothetical protein [Microbacterium sp. BG28]MDY0829136.1 hypothetical protein [Microbacterium sp. BG28]
MTNATDTKPTRARKAPSDRQAKTPTAAEIAEAKRAQDEINAELLAGMPELRPAHRFRLAHRNAFHNLLLDATASGAFDRPELDFDLADPDDIAAFKKLQKFVESIDVWAESIAVDASDYAEWSEGKTEDTFIALFNVYREALGESTGSES